MLYACMLFQSFLEYKISLYYARINLVYISVKTSLSPSTPPPPPNMNQQNTVCSQKCFSTRNREISTAHSFPFLLLPQFFLSPLPPQFLSQLSALTPSLPLFHPTPSLSSFSFLLLPLSYLPQRLLSPLLQQHVLKL